MSALEQLMQSPQNPEDKPKKPMGCSIVGMGFINLFLSLFTILSAFGPYNCIPAILAFLICLAGIAMPIFALIKLKKQLHLVYQWSISCLCIIFLTYLVSSVTSKTPECKAEREAMKQSSTSEVKKNEGQTESASSSVDVQPQAVKQEQEVTESSSNINLDVLESQIQQNAKADNDIVAQGISKGVFKDIRCSEQSGFIDPEVWAAVDYDYKTRISMVLVRYCATRGGQKNLLWTWQDLYTGKVLGGMTPDGPFVND